MGPSVKRRKVSKTEEVNFDPDARHDFLTGFRRRKQERIKHAQAAAEKRYREERRHDRAKMREERALQFKEAYDEHQKQLKRLKEEEDGSASDAEEDEDEDAEEWGGIEEPPAVDYEAEYIDEDKYTTVTVEEMDASREGLRKAVRGDDSEEEEEVKEEDNSAKDKDEEEKPAKKAKKSTTDRPKKNKKRSFRYESKADRKVNAAKQRMSKSKKAKARREQ